MRTPPAHARGPRGQPGPRLLLGLLLPAALLCTSCGGGQNEVHGKVLHKGQPAAGAIVVFHPKGAQGLDVVRPTAVAGEDGSFSLTDHAGKPGAAAGTYVVTVTWPEEPKPAERPKLGTDMELPTPKDRLGGRYSKPDGSKLVVEVKPGVNQLDPFDLQ